MSIQSVSGVDAFALHLTVNPGPDGGGTATVAMATLISPTEAITASHVLHSLGPGSQVAVRLRGSEPVQATVFANDQAADLALLVLVSPLPFRGEMPIVDSKPAPGSTWTSFLMVPAAHDGAVATGVVKGYANLEGLEHIVLEVGTGLDDPAGGSGAPVVVDGSVTGVFARADPRSRARPP